MCAKVINNTFIQNAILVHGTRYTYERCDYIKAKTKVIITCPTHGDFSMIPNNFLSGSNCQLCAKQNKYPKMDTERFIEKCTNLGLFKNYILDDIIYKNSKESINITCKSHGLYSVTADNFITKNHRGCKKCRYESISSKTAHTTTDFVNKCVLLGLDKIYKFDKSQYRGLKKSIVVTCNKHGDFNITSSNLLHNGGSCPKCHTTSKGENLISNLLDSLCVEYIKQYCFDGCRGIKRKLPFDFYIPSYNLCIEYDGRQHFEPVYKFGGEEQFSITLKNDGIKTDYCRDNKITLLRIPYYANYAKTIEDFIKNISNNEYKVL